jgi:hypothetical protein
LRALAALAGVYAVVILAGVMLAGVRRLRR